MLTGPRTFAAAILVTSITVHLGVLPYAWFYFTEDRLWRIPPEIWRLATSFLLSSPALGIILDPYFGRLCCSPHSEAIPG